MKCFGKRMKAWKKCESCKDIVECSATTLCDILIKDGYNVATRLGELIFVDV